MILQRSARVQGLRGQLVASLVVLSSAVITTTAGYFISQRISDMQSELASRRDALEEEMAKRALALAKNVALSSERAMVMLDYLFLTEVITATVNNDDEFLYGALMDSEQRAQVHTDAALAGTILASEHDTFAAAQLKPTTQLIQQEHGRVLEAIAPVHVNDERWGTIRFGLTLHNLENQVEQVQAFTRQRFVHDIIAVLLGSLALVLISYGLATILARRLVRPLNQLMAGADRIRDGHLDEEVAAAGASEFVELATAFNSMARAVRERDSALRENNARIQVALEQAQKAARLKSEFLSNVSHELRTPLNSIVNVPLALLKNYHNQPVWRCLDCAADYQPEGGPLPASKAAGPACPECGEATVGASHVTCKADFSEHQHFLQRLRQSSQHLLNVVNDLLDFSKLEAGRLSLHSKPFLLKDVFSEVVENLSTLAQEKNQHLMFELEDDHLSLHGDKLKMTQVVINLIGNALKFTPPNGRVILQAQKFEYQETPWVRISVHDTGIGIPKESLNDIFESFRQVDGGHTRQYGGTGLGLAITKQLVELHGGRVWAESLIGAGSTFTVEVPQQAVVELTTELNDNCSQRNQWKVTHEKDRRRAIKACGA